MRLIAVLLLTLPVTAQLQTERDRPGPWKRHALSAGKGGWFDSPQPFPLAHFTRYPWLLRVTDPCYHCDPAKELATAKAFKGKSEVHRVGAVHGMAIYDVFYYFEENDPSVSLPIPDWKSILIQTAPNSYREIYHCERSQVDARVMPSVITTVGKERLLSSRYEAGGNGGGHLDDYYWFSPDGPTLVDFEPVWTAAQAVLPDNTRLWRGGDRNTAKTLTSMKFTLNIWRPEDWLCCQPGAIEVSFKLERGRVVVTGTHYDPTADPFHHF